MSSKITIALAILCLAVAAQAQQPAGAWFLAGDADSAVSSTFETLVFSYLDASGHNPYKLQRLGLEELRAKLLQIQESNAAAPPLVIQCGLADYLKILKDPQMKALVSDLHLELLNARLFTYPFYVLKEKAATLQPGGGGLDVAWITLPGSGIQELEDADLLTMLSEALGRPKSSLRIVRERGAYPAAKKLHEGEYGLIGIHEDEPSALLDEFLVNWQEELKADPLEFYPYDLKRITSQLIPVGPGRFSYTFFFYGGDPFATGIPGSRPILAITEEIDHPFPVLLSNSRTAEQGAPISAALSFAYFLMPSFPAVHSMPDSLRWRVEQVYLLNSYLEDPANRYKSLGLLGSLLINREGAGAKAEREIYAEKCDIFQRRLHLPETTADQILKWLGMESPGLGKRELFSSDVSKLYEDALKQMDEALQKSGAARIQLLEKARAGLVAALLQGSRPKNVQGSRGLWSVADYNPYYQLARVALYLEMERRGK